MKPKKVIGYGKVWDTRGDGLHRERKRFVIHSFVKGRDSKNSWGLPCMIKEFPNGSRIKVTVEIVGEEEYMQNVYGKPKNE